MRRAKGGCVDPGGITERSRGVESARPPDMRFAKFAPRRGCQKSQHGIRVMIIAIRECWIGRGSGIPSGCGEFSDHVSGGIGRPQPPATFWQLFELRRDVPNHVAGGDLPSRHGGPQSRFIGTTICQSFGLNCAATGAQHDRISS